MLKSLVKTAALLISLAATLVTASGQVFMSEADALRIIAPQATWNEDVKTLEETARQALARSTRLRFAEPSYRFQFAQAGGHVVGYALTLEEVGKSEPITFTVGMDSTGKVTEVILLVFRERRGGEVRDPRFLRQFRGKSVRDPVQLDRDILNYAGATLSSQALARGVRKALALYEYFYGQGAKPSRVSRNSPFPAPSAASASRAVPSPQKAPRQRALRYVQARYLMGTVCAVEVYAADRTRAVRAVNAAFTAMEDVDRRMSSYRAESELTEVNRQAVRRPVHVSGELFQVLSFAQNLSEASEGAFDITVAPLLRAWGFLPPRIETLAPVAGDAGGRLRPPDVRGATLAVGYCKVRLDPVTHTVRFTAPGVELDLGGIAKGYAVDRAVEVLRAWGVGAGRVSTGGSTVYALGAQPRTPSGWRITLPMGTAITIRDAALSTSGHSERFVELAGRRYSHIFDPRRGQPVSTAMATVSVLAPTAMESDALTKPFFILNEREQEKLIRHFPRIHVWLERAPAPCAAAAAVD